MKFSLRHTFALAAFFAFAQAGPSAHAQAVQQGNGALVQKTERQECMTAQLTGLSRCVPMTQTSYVITPSGNETSIWKGTVPADLRPAQTLVKDATWQERGITFDTHSVTTPSGEISLTLHYKENGKKSTGNGKGRRG